MENNINIEDLFKNTLENAEATPPAGAWEAIQAKMGATAASTAAGTTATGLTMGKIAAIVITALGVGLGVGYFAFKGTGKPKEGQTTTTQNHSAEASTSQASENTTTLPKDVEITNVSSVNKADKIISIVEVKKGEKIEKVRIEIPVSAGNNNGSVVNQWLSPKKDKITRDQMIQRIMDELDKEDTGEAVVENNPVVTTNKKEEPQILVSKVEEHYVEANISATINPENPLQASFSNITDASSYEWNFGDNTSSKQASPTHTYTEPGNYTVTVKISDKSGKTYSNSTQLEVKAKEEDPLTKSSFGIKVEEIAGRTIIFTPNNDGVNDRIQFESQNIESLVFTIYSADNKVVYNTTDISMQWTGTDRGGNDLPSGTYKCVYKAVGKDKKLHKDGFDIVINR